MSREWAIPFRSAARDNRLLADELLKAVDHVIAGGDYFGGGNPGVIGAFEDALSAYFSRPVVAVSSGTSAIELALRAFGIGAGDEVITVANTFAATAEAILCTGATPVFVDVRPAGGLMDVDAVATAVTPRTRAVVPVHLHGNVVPMDPLLDVAARHGLVVVEDCAQAMGSTYRGRLAGTVGDAGCLSFYPGKNLGGLGEGGAVVAGSWDVAFRIARLANHGGCHEPSGPYVVGHNARLGAIEAAVLHCKLRHVDAWNASRRSAAATYDEWLGGVPAVRVLPRHPACVHSHHLYVVMVPRRDEVYRRLREAGIECGIHYPRPLHQLAPYRPVTRAATPLPHTERHCAETLSLPLHVDMSPEVIREVVDTLRVAVADA